MGLITVSHRFRDKRRFRLKIANISYFHAFNVPADGVGVSLAMRHSISTYGLTALEREMSTLPTVLWSMTHVTLPDGFPLE